jgi:hypothetical protein
VLLTIDGERGQSRSSAPDHALNQMRALNMPIPDDLAQMEADMSKEFAAEAAEAGDTPKPDA